MNKPLIQVPIKYGIAASALLMLLFVILFYMGKHPINISVLDIRLLILPIFIFIGVKDFRDNKNGGTLHFWQAVSIGGIIFLTIGILISLFIIFFVAVDANFLQLYIDERVTLIVEHKEQFLEQLGEATINEQLEKLPLTTSLNLAIDYFVRTLAFGLFFNLIISVLLRRQPNINTKTT